MLILIAVFAVSLSTAPVYAAPTEAVTTHTYARATVKDAYFFTDKNNNAALFAVPYTYCVEVLRDEGDWFYARYANDTGVYKSLNGYCQKKDFTIESTTPQTTFLYKIVTVTYTADTRVPSLPVLSEIALEAAYYGTYDAGAAVYSYVYCQGSFGYIEGANDDYPLNVAETDAAGEKDGTDKTDGEKGGLSFAAIAFIVIAVLFAAVILVIYFATRKPRYEG